MNTGLRAGEKTQRTKVSGADISLLPTNKQKNNEILGDYGGRPSEPCQTMGREMGGPRQWKQGAGVGSHGLAIHERLKNERVFTHWTKTGTRGGGRVNQPLGKQKTPWPGKKGKKL